MFFSRLEWNILAQQLPAEVRMNLDSYSFFFFLSSATKQKHFHLAEQMFIQ
jgi:hypothetical protein